MSGPSNLLYSRSSTVTVGTIQIVNIGQNIGLDVWFDVKRTLKPNEPNTCDLRIYNLADSSLKAIASATQTSTNPALPPSASNGVVPVKIVAGYESGTSTIFLGEMRSAQTVRDGDDFVTELTSGDGDFAQIYARLNVQAPRGTSAYTVVQQCLTAMKSGNGNLSAVAQTLRGATMYQQGAVLKGNAHDLLVDICRSVGLEVKIQNGQAQFLSLGQPLAGQAYNLTPNTGLIGEPSVDTKGVMSCMTLMLPELIPGKAVVVNSRFVSGTYRVVSMDTSGSTFDNEWGHRLECKYLGRAP